MGVFARDEQQIKMGDVGKAKQRRMKWALELTLYPSFTGFNEGGQSVLKLALMFHFIPQ